MGKVLVRTSPIRGLLETMNIEFDDRAKPHAISIYNRLSHGTDLRNQEVEAFRSPKTGKKWWL